MKETYLIVDTSSIYGSNKPVCIMENKGDAEKIEKESFGYLVVKRIPVFNSLKEYEKFIADSVEKR